jgi:hypothetical protein
MAANDHDGNIHAVLDAVANDGVTAITYHRPEEILHG